MRWSSDADSRERALVELNQAMTEAMKPLFDAIRWLLDLIISEPEER